MPALMSSVTSLLLRPLLPLLLALAVPVPAAAESPTWITDAKGCKIVNLAPQEGESVTWSGECPNGLANGEGTLTWFVAGVKTEVYEGMMVDGYAEGRGKLKRRGSAYVGEWKKSLQHGRGRYDDEDGSWYQGEWSEGLPHGRGQMLTPDGQLLKGYWNNGEFEDEGAMPSHT